jgi:uncharacterized protein (TIGR02453 family)
MVSVIGMSKSNTTVLQAFPAGSLKFLAALSKNNKREWFQPRKAEFDEVLHTPLIQFANLVNDMLLKSAPEYAVLEPAKTLNRIYRDIRFSADKTPYQTHVSFYFPHGRLGKKAGAGLYFHLAATGAMIAGGMYFGETRELQVVRQHLAQFRAILAAKALQQTFGQLSGECLQKCPKQFGADHPAADLLKQKQWLLSTNWPAKAAVEESFAQDAIKALKLLIPFVTFLNEPLKSKAAAVTEF